MRFVYALLISLSVAFSGCGPTMVSYTGCTAFWEAQHFPIVVSPDATLDESDLAYVALAAQRWNVRAGREVFVLKPGYLQKPGGEDQAGIVVSIRNLPNPLLGYCPSVYKDSIEGRLGSVMRSICLIDRTRIGDDPVKYVNVVTHELGHALGFPHDDSDPNGLMFPTMSKGDGVKEISSEHLDVVHKMMNDEYKDRTAFGLPSCF